jgi:hypothetical protein
VGVAGQHLLHRLGIVVEHQVLGLWPQDLGQGRRRRAAPEGELHVRLVEVLDGLELAGQRQARGKADTGMRIGHREVDREVARRRDRHAADDHVELTGDQGRNDAVPRSRHELDLDPHVLGQLLGDVDLEADQLAVRGVHRPGHEGRQAHLHGAALLDRLDHARGGDLLVLCLRAAEHSDGQGQPAQPAKHSEPSHPSSPLVMLLQLAIWPAQSRVRNQ